MPLGFQPACDGFAQFRWLPPVNEFIDEVNKAEHTQAEAIAARAVNKLHAGLGNSSVTVSAVVVAGDPKQVLVQHAEEFGADCIFTGATGFSTPIERFLVGIVSAAVAARAPCSVEVVRVPKAGYELTVSPTHSDGV